MIINITRENKFAFLYFPVPFYEESFDRRSCGFINIMTFFIVSVLIPKRFCVSKLYKTYSNKIKLQKF